MLLNLKGYQPLSNQLLKILNVSNHKNIGFYLSGKNQKQIFKNEFWDKYLNDFFQLGSFQNIDVNILFNGLINNYGVKSKNCFWILSKVNNLQSQTFVFFQSVLMLSNGDKFCDSSYILKIERLDDIKIKIIDFLDSFSFLVSDSISFRCNVIESSSKINVMSVDDIGHRV